MTFLFENVECFRTVLADPPWAFENFGQMKHGAARAHYTLMSDEALAAIPVRKWAADDALLFLWTCWPKIAAAIEVARAWGFPEQVTGFPWVKTCPGSETIRTGIGFWVQHASEPLLIFRGGSGVARFDAPPRHVGLLVGEDRQFYAPLSKKAKCGRKHSEKPEGVQDWIEQTVPGPYLELFARRERPGWTAWGDELGFHLDVQGVHEVERVAPLSLAPRGGAP